MSDTSTSAEATSFATQLLAATQGLSFQSESDAPVEPFTPAPNQAGAEVTPEAILALSGQPASTPVKTTTLATFFKPATEEQDWFNDEEKATAKRFQDLVQLLKDNLQHIKVFKIGTTEQDVFVVGTTRDGQIAGVKTKVVET